MRAALIFLYIEIYLVESSIQARMKSKSDPIFKSAIQEAIHKSATHDITVIANDTRKDDTCQSVIETVLNIATKFGPTQYVTSKDLNYSTIQHRQLATSRTLMVYITDETVEPSIVNNIKNDIFAMSHGNHLPKLLLIFVGQVFTGWKIFLQDIWEHWKMIDVTVLHVVRNNVPEKEFYLTVHQLNPFNGEYTGDSFDVEKTDWFPDKTKNMYGYPFVFGIIQDETCDTEKMIIEDLDERDIENISHNLRKVMNFTLKLKCDNNFGSNADIYDRRTLQTHSNLLSDFTVTITMYGYRLLIPIIQQEPTIAIWKMFVTVLVGIFIVAIFWITTTVLKFERIFSSPIRTISIMLGVSIDRMPNAFSGKILFLCLVVASTRYTCMFYNELFNMGVTTITELDITNIDDLAASGLTVLVDEVTANNMMTDGDVPADMKKRIWNTSLEISSSEYIDYLTVHKNISMFWFEQGVQSYISMFAKICKRRALKKANYNLYNHQVVYIIPIRSPYKNRINEILLRLHESGFIQRKLRELELLDERWLLKYYGIQEDNDSSNPPENFVVKSLLFVYFLSLIAFVGEVILGYYMSRKETLIVSVRRGTRPK